MAKRKQHTHRRPRRAGGSTGIYIAGGAIALAMVAAVIMLATASRDNDDGANAPIVMPTPRPDAVSTSGMVYGEPGAPVTVTEYVDFQCPVCLRASHTVIAEIEERYVETGQVKVEVKPIAILGDESVAATEAAHCAAAQGQFWPYHDILFANQGAENDGGFNDSRLKEFAARLGLNSASFDSCLDSHTYKAAVESNTDAAKAQGVSGTPAVFVNEARVETSVEAISAAIDANLSGG